ncbi:MAG: nucleotide exchange factor GrpE [Candidatus Poseidoniaceae archaeon]|jgi:molecular chaperone GrpE (heat shock protein)|nr:nucleotide exchange factor GrpE [Candidatus Poseidoniaceae archaeon]
MAEDKPEEVVDDIEEEIAEEIDPLVEAITRAELAEKEITYRDAEIQNIRKRLMSEKAIAIQYGGMGMARKMLVILSDIDRALSVNDDEGLALIRSKMWTELLSEGVSRVEAKGQKFDPNCMEAITTIQPTEEFPANTVIDVIEEGYMFKERILIPARVVVASNQ